MQAYIDLCRMSVASAGCTTEAGIVNTSSPYDASEAHERVLACFGSSRWLDVVLTD